MSDQPVSDTRPVIRSFGSIEEFGALIAAHAGPPRPDDLPVIAGQAPGPRRRATHDELVALFGDEPAIQV